MFCEAIGAEARPFKAEAIERLEQKTATLEREIADVTLASMGKDAYNNLNELASGAFGPYKIEPHIGLHTELYHLRKLGLVSLRESRPSTVRSIGDIPAEGAELSTYVEVTGTGRRYLELRRRSERRGD